MKADLHVHSVHSDDGRQTVEDLIKRCEELGIGAVAITDHNTMRAHFEEVSKYEGKMIIVPAVEVTTTGGHVLAYGIKSDIPRGLSVAETVRMIHEAGGIAVAPHTYRLWSGLGEANVRANAFDAIETINGRSRKRGNRRAKRLAASLKLPEVGGSDAHNTMSVGRSYTELPDGCRDWEDIIAAVRSGRCSARGDDLSSSSSLGHGALNISRWFRRGFRRM